MYNTKKSSVKQLSIIILITMITQLFILARASIIAAKFGVSADLDAFNFANSIATLIFSFISAGITTVLIPNLGDDEKKKSINSFITILYSIATIMLLITIFFRKEIISLFSENTTSAFINTASIIMIILLISQYISSYIGLSNAVLQYQNKFNRSKLIILVTNILMVILLLWKSGDDIYKYAIAVLITAIINVTLQFILVYKSDFKFKFSIDLRDENLKIMIKTFLPIILSTGLYQISLMIDIIIASGLGAGKISILNYSNYIIGMINMLLIVNITSFLYPKIAKSIKSKDSQDKLIRYITSINMILSFIVVAVIVLGQDALAILYMRGSFTPEVNNMVYICTGIYIISIPASAIRDIIYKYFYANSDTYTPFKNSLIVSILNIVLSIILAKYIGLYGVVLGTTITSIISLVFIGIKFKKRYGTRFEKRFVILENLKITIATISSLIILIILRFNFEFNNALLNILIYVAILFIIYIAILFGLKSKFLKIKSKELI